MSEYRRNPFTGLWVLIAPEASVRPRRRETLIARTPEADCPFCPGAEQVCGNDIYALRTPGLLAGSPWSLRVIANRLPLLRIEARPFHSADGERQDGLGVHEVVIETPRHDLSFVEYPIELAADVIGSWRDRIRDLMNDMRMNYFLVHRTEGLARQSHPHSQLLAFPVSAAILAGYPSAWAKEEYGPHPAQRRILAYQGWTAYMEYAQPHPFEVQISPQDIQTDFLGLQDLRPLAAVVRDIWRRLSLALAGTPVRLVLRYERAPGSVPPGHRWRISLRPELEMFLPEEPETGICINPVPPEEAVQVIRALPEKESLPDSGYLLPLE